MHSLSSKSIAASSFPVVRVGIDSTVFLSRDPTDDGACISQFMETVSSRIQSTENFLTRKQFQNSFPSLLYHQ